MSQLPILGPTDKSSAPTGWCSTLSRSGYTTLLTLKEASGSRNYLMHSERLRTQPSKPTEQSPYFLIYGSEAILPADVMWDSPVVEHYDEGVSEDSRRVDIDGLEEARCAALVQSARYLEGIRRYHDRNVKERSFNVGDLVLRRIQNTEGLHKLSSPWEGPFTVAKVTGPGSYCLQTLEGEDVNNSWNVDQLCRFYA
jgi:hypothetical protein